MRCKTPLLFSTCSVLFFRHLLDTHTHTHTHTRRADRSHPRAGTLGCPVSWTSSRRAVTRQTLCLRHLIKATLKSLNTLALSLFVFFMVKAKLLDQTAPHSNIQTLSRLKYPSMNSLDPTLNIRKISGSPRLFFTETAELFYIKTQSRKSWCVLMTLAHSFCASTAEDRRSIRAACVYSLLLILFLLSLHALPV